MKLTELPVDLSLHAADVEEHVHPENILRKIRLIEGNAKCRHLKKLTFKGTLRQVFKIR